MKKMAGIKFSGNLIKFSIVVLLALLVTGAAWAEFTPEKVHFLIPGGAGGGWDGTARGVGKALVDSGILKHASFENMSGGGGLRHSQTCLIRKHVRRGRGQGPQPPDFDGPAPARYHDG
jgi:hypothetical protein